MQKNIQRIIVLGMAVAMTACGGAGVPSVGTAGGGASTIIVDIPSLSDTPYATDIVASSSSNLAVQEESEDTAKSSGWDVVKAAATGAVFGTLKTASYTSPSTQSMGHCYTANQIIDASMEPAAKGDFYLCLMKNLGQDTLLADEAYHVLSITNNTDFPDKVRVKVVKDSDNNITSYAMQTCEGSTQISHNEFSRSGQDLTMKSIAVNTTGSGLVTTKRRATVTGTLNSSGNFLSKTVATDATVAISDGSGSMFAQGTMVQNASSYTYSGYDSRTYDGSGSHCSDASSNTEVVNMYAVVQSIPNTSTPHVIASDAIGDGSMKGSITYSCDGVAGDEATPIEQSWNGDTFATITDGDYESSIADAELGTMATSLTVDFTADETVTCGDLTAEATVDAAAIDCSNFDLNFSDLMCYSIFNEEEQVTFSFSTPGYGVGDENVDEIPLSIDAANPTGVAVAGNIIIGVNYTYAIDPSTATNSSIVITKLSDSSVITPVSISVLSDNMSLGIDIDAFEAGENYKIVLKSGADGVKQSDGTLLTSSGTYYMVGE